MRRAGGRPLLEGYGGMRWGRPLLEGYGGDAPGWREAASGRLRGRCAGLRAAAPKTEIHFIIFKLFNNLFFKILFDILQIKRYL